MLVVVLAVPWSVRHGGPDALDPEVVDKLHEPIDLHCKPSILFGFRSTLAASKNSFGRKRSMAREPACSASSAEDQDDRERNEDEEGLIRRRVNNELNFPSNSERLVLGCIDADFCK